MAQLYYKYGTMNSGKTIEILKVAHNYEEQGKPVVIMTSALDTRDGFGKVSSRIGMKREAVAIDDEHKERKRGQHGGTCHADIHIRAAAQVK